MYGLLKPLLPRPLAEAATVIWYCGLLLLILHFSAHDQARFVYVEF